MTVRKEDADLDAGLGPHAMDRKVSQGRGTEVVFSWIVARPGCCLPALILRYDRMASKSSKSGSIIYTGHSEMEAFF
jgi:hypothetical protein